MPQITANISTETKVKRARRLALAAGVSLRDWAGDIIEKHLEPARKRLKSKPNLKD